jgi:hypothetical protein
MDASLLKYPRKSHRKPIDLPPDSPLLAEFMGILAGDGGVNNEWQLAITVNSIADHEYANYIAGAINRLFGIEPSLLERERHTLRIICNSAALIDFVVEKGFTRGHKVRLQITFPSWVNKNNGYKRAFVRGLVDTDGCMFIHKHKVGKKEYKNIGLTFSSHAAELIRGVSTSLRNNGIKPHLSRNGRSIYLYKEESVVKYLSIFGSSNPRITRKYEEWRGVRVA